MPLLNSNIAKAFIESYLSFKKKEWLQDKPIDSPISGTPAFKIFTCTRCLQAIQHAGSTQSIESWKDAYFEIYNFAQSDKAEEAKTENMFRTKKLHLVKTLFATLSWIYDQLNNEDRSTSMQLNDIKFGLIQQRKTIQAKLDETDFQETNDSAKDQEEINDITNKLASLYDLDAVVKIRKDSDVKETPNYLLPNYHKTYFEEVTLIMDPESKRLNEKSFNDFKTNILNGSRKLDNCETLLKSQEKKAAAAAPSESHKEEAVVESSKESPKPVMPLPTMPSIETQLAPAPSLFIPNSIFTTKKRRTKQSYQQIRPRNQ